MINVKFVMEEYTTGSHPQAKFGPDRQMSACRSPKIKKMVKFAFFSQGWK